MSPPLLKDPSDARQVFNSLRGRLDEALAEKGNPGFGCLRAVPRIDGTVYFDLKMPSGQRRLNWIGPSTEASGLRNELAFSSKGPRTSREELTLELADEVLRDILDEEQFFLLHFYNQGISRLVFDDGVVDRLLAGRLEPGRTSWFGYRFSDAFQESSERFRLTFHGHGGPVSFEVRPAVPPFEEEKLVLKNHIIALYLVEDSREASWRSRVAHQIERFVGFVLSRAVHPAMVLDAGSLAETGDSDDSAPISTSRWGNPRQWFQFFSDFEIERSNLCSFRFTDPISWITHGEKECCWVEPDVLPRPVTYTNVPWEQDLETGAEGSSSIYTHLDEKDVVMGGRRKLKAALEEASANPKARFVCMNNTCLPKIIGDDVLSMLQKFAKTSPLPILNLNTDLDSPDSAFSDFVRQAKESLDEDEVPGKNERQGVNLVGFPPNRGLRELEGCLAEIGVPVNTRVLPDVGMNVLREYLAGQVAVVYPHHTWVEIARAVLDDLGVPWHILPAPYGFEQTMRWFTAIAEMAGKNEEFEKMSSVWRERFLPRWQRLTDACASHGLAFVVDNKASERLVNAEQNYGFSILPLLEEMGFRLSVLVREDEAGTEPDTGPLAAALREPQRHEFLVFSSPAELNHLLQEGSFQAVYSEVFFDTRLTRAGKAQFNLGMLEMGLNGALRGIKRLLRVCRWNFYDKYRRYLGVRAETR